MSSVPELPGHRPRHEVLLVDLIVEDPEILQDLADLLWRSGFLTRVPADAGDGAADVAVLHESAGSGAPPPETATPAATPAVHVVSATRAEVARAVARGARGIVLADRLDATLPPTIRAVHAGQLALPREFHRLIARPALSHREREVLRLVVQGATNAEIAATLYLETSTVKSHISTVLAKLGANGRREATFMVLDPQVGFGAGIFDLPVAPVQPHGNGHGNGTSAAAGLEPVAEG